MPSATLTQHPVGQVIDRLPVARLKDGSTFHKPLTVGPYLPNHPEVLAGIAGYEGDREAYEHDHVAGCSECDYRAWVGLGFRSDWVGNAGFDTDIYAQDGVLVCEDCAPLYVEGSCYDPYAEHGTLYARGGSVVG